jgi:hypothetical protein
MFLRRLALAALLLIGLAALWWSGREEDQRFDTRQAPGLAADVESSRLYKLRFENLPRDTAITFERDSAGLWLITDPIPWRAEDGVVRQLIDALRNSPAEPAPGADPARVELAPERARVVLYERIAGAGERVTSVRIGALDVDGEHVFAAREGQPGIVRVSRGLRELLEFDLSFYRSKRLLEFLPQEVTVLERRGRFEPPLLSGAPGPGPGGERTPGTPLDPADLTLRLEQGAGQWELSSPFRARANPSLAYSLLMILSQARATAFPDDQPQDLTPYGLDRPWFELAIELGPDRRERLAFAAGAEVGPESSVEELLGEDIWFVRREGLPNVFRVDASLLRSLTQPALELVDANLFSVRREDLLRFEVELDGPLARSAGREPGSGLILRQRTPAFDVAERGAAEPEWRLADRGLCSDFLAPLLSLSSAAAIDPGEAPSTVASGWLRLETATAEPQAVELGGHGELAGVAGSWLRRRGETPWHFVTPPIDGRLLVRAVDLLSKAPFELEELGLARIELEVAGSSKVWVREREKAIWCPEGLIAEDKRFAGLVDALIGPKVEGWELGPGVPSLETLGSGPVLEVRVVPGDGPAGRSRLARDPQGQVWLEFDDRIGPARVEAFERALELLR